VSRYYGASEAVYPYNVVEKIHENCRSKMCQCLAAGGIITPVHLPSPGGPDGPWPYDRYDIVLCTDSVLFIWPGADKTPIF
jgi:hypothetical protein